ncbi:hypothetical protein E4U42_003810 [Claviceps africana]|uniref:SMP-30/Gluconolactonase/LRE-like region domain-containing protein n=1 Tax=Claviceps africana TaxID=83212 RepID=A0A8K0JC95_9HYPO|nr:hypothetical protein E4U42_003810 [Claviceps africana]
MMLGWSLSCCAAAAMAAGAAPFAVFHNDVKRLYGPWPVLEMLHENKSVPFAHEAGVFIQRDNTLFVTSNRFQDPVTREQRIVISRVALPPSRSPRPVRVEEVGTRHVAMANGGVNYGGGILFCAQGTRDSPGGLFLMESKPPYRSRCLVQSYMNRPFNSPNDVVIHSDGSIWFTDPYYGFEQGFRPRPRLPSQVYRFDPRKKSVRVMADGFGMPNGISFSPDQTIVYVTDTDRIHGNGTIDDTRPSTIYAFDVDTSAGQPFLTNRRLFAMADAGVPDGIKCDVHGNVYTGAGDGLNIWSPDGTLLGKILVEGGVSNFCFGRAGEIFLLNENRLFRAQLASSTKGALLRV